jgi:FkbM family methyltransferase
MRESIKKIIPKNSFLYSIISKIYNYKTNNSSWLPEKKAVGEILKKYADNKKDVRFIQIGSNDGMSGDPIFEYIVKNNWTGVLVEPVPYLYEKLKLNYHAHQKVLFFENSAIANVDGTAKFYRLKQSTDPNMPKWYDQLGSFNKEIVIRHKDELSDFDELFIEEDIPTTSFDSLLKKYNFYNVDLIHIDTEGYDFEIIKLFNFNLIKPEVILYEHKHLHPKDHKHSIELLKKHGYTLFVDMRDTIALKTALMKIYK